METQEKETRNNEKNPNFMLITTQYNTTRCKMISHTTSYNDIIPAYILMNAIPRFNFKMEGINYMERNTNLEFLCKMVLNGCRRAPSLSYKSEESLKLESG